MQLTIIPNSSFPLEAFQDVLQSLISDIHIGMYLVVASQFFVPLLDVSDCW